MQVSAPRRELFAGGTPIATPRGGAGVRRWPVVRQRSSETRRETALGLARRLPLAPISHAVARAPLHDVLIEPAWDGQRVLAVRAGDDVRLVGPDGRDWTAAFPGPARALARLPVRSLAIDGVVCILDQRGAPSFELLRAGVASGAAANAIAMCWDLIWLDGEDLRGAALAERRARLAALLATAGAPALVESPALDGALERVVAAAAGLGLRGVVARARLGGYDAWWSSYSAGAAIEWQRSLSPPPPLSNADKVLYPRDGICKRDIAGYYRDVAPLLVRYLADRPVVVQRWPDGIDEFAWYQHRMPPRAPDYLRAAMIDGVRRIVIDRADALLWMVNQAGLTFHGFASRLTTLDQPDFVVLDLDPGDRATWWSELVEVAGAVRGVLELLELPSVVKTSGQRGLHVLIPIARGHRFDEADALGRSIAMLIERLLPDKVTLEIDKAKRRGRLLFDHKQFVAKTLVAPYSLRGVDGAPVSTPLAWDEVGVALSPRSFTLRTLRARLDARGDLAAPLVAGTARLDAALARLAARLPRARGGP